MNLKTKLMLIVALVATFVFPASALEYNDGALTWRYFPLEGSTTEARLGDGTNACIAASVEGEITLPGKIGAYTVMTVSANAFKGCSKIAGVSILENIEYIDEGAFDGATALKRISVINRNENFFSYKGVLYSGDFFEAKLVRVPAGFDAEEFDGLVKPHVRHACPDAFNGCANIKRIKVDSWSAESLADCLFLGCTGFTEFVWDEDEWDECYDYFCVKDGVLYDCNCRGLVKWPSAKPIAGFEGLKLNDFAEFNVREGAFAGNSIESVSIPDGVSIEAYAFIGCANLKTVSFLGRVDQQCGVLDSAEDAGLNLEKVIYPGFPKDKSDEWRDEIDRFKETYPESKIVFEKAEDPNAGKTNITIPYTERHDILWKYDFESYAKDLTTITFDGPCPDDFGDILAVCTNVVTIVYSANPIYRDADYDWESWKIVMSRDWGNELPGRRITFEEGAIPSETQFCFEDPEYRDCLSGIWYYDEALDCEVCLSPIWPVAGELRIPDGVYELGEGALCGLDQVTELVLPQMMAWGEISEDVGFETMTNLVEIEVEGGRTSFCNDCYYSVDGCLYSDGRLVRVPPAYDADEFVIVGEDCPESNALVGCRNIRKLTAGNCDLLECVLYELDLTGCDQLVEFGCRESKWESLSDYGYAIIDGAIYDGDRYFGDWEEWERKLLMWPNGKRPIEFANGTTEVDPEVFRYLAHPEAITELTLPERCKDFDLYALADEYGFTNVTRIVCQGYPWALSTDLPEVMPKLAEIVHNPCPWYGWDEFIAEFKAEHPESTVVFNEMQIPEGPIYECDPVDEGICYIGDGVYPFVYPSPKGAYEVPEEIKGLRVVAAYENAFANMDELTEVTFPASFVWLEAGVQTNKLNRKTGENIPIDPPRYYSPFVGCTSLSKLVFKGRCPDGLCEALEQTPSVVEVDYIDIPWYGWGEFIAEFKSDHPESTVAFVEMPTPEGPIYNCECDDVEGICYLGDSVYPFVHPTPKGAYEVPEEINGCRVVEVYENAFVNMDELTEVTFPASLDWLEAGVQTNKWNKKTGENIPVDPPRYYSPFVGCTSLSKLVFKGRCPDGLCEALEQTPSVVEVDYIDIPWYGWGEFIAEFKAEHPESTVAFVEMPTPEEPIYNCQFEFWWDDYDNVVGECYLGDCDYPFVYPSPKGAYEVPEEINGYRVVEAYENAFVNMDELTEVTFPASFWCLDAGTSSFGYWDDNEGEWVTTNEIPYSPFVGCTSLSKLVFKGRCPDGLCETLEQTPSVVEVDYVGIPWYGWGEFIADFKAEHPDSPVVFNEMPIPERTFWNVEDGGLWGEYDEESGARIPCVCPDLVGEAEVPDGVYEIGENAFAGMAELTALTFPETLEWIEADSYTDEVGYYDEEAGLWVPTGCVHVVYSPFVGCTSLSKLVFKGCCPPEGLRELLEGTTVIREIVVPDVNKYEDDEWLTFVEEFCEEYPHCGITFKRADGTGVMPEPPSPWTVEGDTLTVSSGAEIYGGGFDGYDLSAVTKLVLPDYVEHMDDEVFADLPNLQSVEIVVSNHHSYDEDYGERDEEDLWWWNEEDVWWLDNLGWAFGEDQRLSLAIRIEDEDLEICVPDCSFDCSPWLVDLTISDGVWGIAEYAFGECENLKTVTLPESLVYMGESVFACCTNLETVYFNGNAPYGCEWLYEETPATLVTYVKYGSTGWNGIEGSPEMPELALWPVWEENDETARAVKYGTGAVTYMVNGTVDEVKDIPICMPFALKDISKTGYTFSGWRDEAGCPITGGDELMFCSFGDTLTVFAEFSPNPYAVAFNANGGSGTMADEAMTYDSAKPLTACAFTRTGYTFAGWATSADGAVAYADRASVKDLATSGKVTLYAKWEEIVVPPPAPPVDSSLEDFKVQQKMLIIGGEIAGPFPWSENVSTAIELVLAAVDAATDEKGVLDAVTAGREMIEAARLKDAENPDLGGSIPGCDLVWELADHTLRVDGNGTMSALTHETAPWSNSLDRVESVVLGGDVTAVCAGLFSSDLAAPAKSVIFGASECAVTLAAFVSVDGSETNGTADVMFLRGGKYVAPQYWTDGDKAYGSYAEALADGCAIVMPAFSARPETAEEAVETAPAIIREQVVVLDVAGKPAVVDVVTANVNENNVQAADRVVATAVEGLSEVAVAFAAAGTAVSSVQLMIDSVPADTGDEAKQDAHGLLVQAMATSLDDAAGLEVKFAEIVLSVNGEPVADAGGLIAITIPFETKGRKDFSVSRFHEGEAQLFRRIGEVDADIADGTFRVGDGTITFWTEKFSDYAIASVLAVVDPLVTNTITYLGLEGAANANPTQFTAEDLPLTLSSLSRDGYRFLGWTPNGGVIPAGTVTNVAFSAHWTANRYTIAFDANGGEGVMAAQTFVYDQPQTLSVVAFERKTCEFLGWSTTVDGEVEFADGAMINNLFDADGATLTLYAVWNRVGIAPRESRVVIDETTGETKEVIVLPEDEPEFEGVAAVYDGFVMSVEGEIVGSIQVKAAKANKKSGISALTATMQIVGEKKLSFKGGEWGPSSEYAEMALKDGRTLIVAIGKTGLVGTFGDYEINGSVNRFSARDDETKALVKEIESKWVGTINVVGDDVALVVSVAKKGKVKVTGNAGNVKVSVTSQLLVGETACCVPVVITKKNANLAFNIWLMDDGTVEIDGLESADVGKAGTLKPGATFAFGDDGALGERTLPGLLTKYLPNGLSVVQNKTKWVVAPDEKGKAAKAGKVTFNKKAGAIDEAKLGENPSALKLTFTAKTGSFKGSFKAYTLINNKVKAYTFNVTGVMIGDTGYGTATLKKPEISVPIVIE